MKNALRVPPSRRARSHFSPDDSTRARAAASRPEAHHHQEQAVSPTVPHVCLEAWLGHSLKMISGTLFHQFVLHFLFYLNEKIVLSV